MSSNKRPADLEQGVHEDDGREGVALQDLGDDDRHHEVSAKAPAAPPIGASLQELNRPQQNGIPAAVYVAIWIFFSGSVILYNKWVLDTAGFPFPITLTTWHLIFATVATQIMARTTKLLDGRFKVPMTGAIYLRAIVPIGAFFSLSLICSNVAYLYLTVSFIQMLKATTPVAVLVVTWIMRLAKFDMRVLLNVSVIVFGVVIASYGEVNFVLVGVTFQVAGIMFESVRLAMVQRLLSSSEFKMDPLVSLYYFAPVCAVMNFLCCLVFEGHKLSLAAIQEVGIISLTLNAAVALCLNISVVFLIGKTSSLVLTLSGVLKDILLVCASVAIWHSPVSMLQMFGYSIALGGLMYYKLGAEQIYRNIEGVSAAFRQAPAPYKALSVCGACGILLLVFIGSKHLAFDGSVVGETPQN